MLAGEFFFAKIHFSGKKSQDASALRFKSPSGPLPVQYGLTSCSLPVHLVTIDLSGVKFRSIQSLPGQPSIISPLFPKMRDDRTDGNNLKYPFVNACMGPKKPLPT